MTTEAQSKRAPNGKKRQSPSIERQLALALVGMLETLGRPDELDIAATDARAILNSHGYGGLESIATRVKRIETEITEALKAQDGAKLAQLGAMLDRAKKGLPPLAGEKKTQPAKPKTRKKKDVQSGANDEGGKEPDRLTRHPEPEV